MAEAPTCAGVAARIRAKPPDLFANRLASQGMEREIRSWWTDLSRADQDAWISAWETDVVSDDVILTVPVGRLDRWTTGEQARRPAPRLADFLEQQAAARFLNAGQPSRRP